MKLTILTTVTNPDQRQDRWIEALQCYTDLADEVVIVNGGDDSLMQKFVNAFPIGGSLTWQEKIVEVMFPWPERWNWIEFPRHLNEGLKYCTGDWILRLDIDQFIHEDDFKELRKQLETAPESCKSALFVKTSFTYALKYYQKGEQEIAFRRMPGLAFGENIKYETDLCFPIIQQGERYIYDDKGELIYKLPRGYPLQKKFRTGVSYWNYDYYFKTEEVAKRQFWSMAQAYHDFYGIWKFGDSKESAFEAFLDMQRSRFKKCPYTAKALVIHPKYIQQAIFNLTPEQWGFNGWGSI